MRLGEIRSIVRQATNTSDQLVVEADPIFEGQAYKINNYGKLIEALKAIASQQWNDVDFSPITTISDAYKALPVQTITNTEYDQLNAYVSTVNQKMPIFLGIIETLVDEQDPKTVNIKLPESIKSINDLDTFNKRLLGIFKRFNLAGEFQFEGFDHGSSWYEVLVTAELLYRYFIACTAVAIAIAHFKKTFYEAENAKLTYKVAVKDKEKTRDEFLDEVVEQKLEADISKVITEIEKTDGKTPPELRNELVAATTELVKELGHGTEFHLSFNPPIYADESNRGSLKIDYSKMQSLEKKEETKEISDGKAK